MKLRGRKIAVVVGTILFLYAGAANAYSQCSLGWDSEHVDDTPPSIEATLLETTPNENFPLDPSETIHCVDYSHQLEYVVEKLRLESGMLPRDGDSLKKSFSSKVVTVSSGVIDGPLLFPLRRSSSISFLEISSLHVFLSVFRI